MNTFWYEKLITLDTITNFYSNHPINIKINIISNLVFKALKGSHYKYCRKIRNLLITIKKIVSIKINLKHLV